MLPLILAVVAVVLSAVALWIAVFRPGPAGPRGPQGPKGSTYYPLMAVHEIKPGSIIHLHNMIFDDDWDSDDPLTDRTMDEFLKAIGHTNFLVVRTESGEYDAPEMVGVWPEGEAADRLKALMGQSEVSR